MSFMTPDEIAVLGFRHVGENCLLSSKASFYNCSNISIGNNVRIDDFCVLSAGKGGIDIGNYIHIAIYSSIMGDEKIILNDFSGLSSRVSVYSSSDDYGGHAMTNPMVADEFKKVLHAPVILDKHVIIGSGSIVLPGCHIHIGSAVGALSLVTKDIPEFEIHTGMPARKIKKRNKNLLDLEQQFWDKSK